MTKLWEERRWTREEKEGHEVEELTQGRWGIEVSDLAGRILIDLGCPRKTASEEMARAANSTHSSSVSVCSWREASSSCLQKVCLLGFGGGTELGVLMGEPTR